MQRDTALTLIAAILLLAFTGAAIADIINYQDNASMREQAVSPITPMPVNERGPGPLNIATSVVAILTTPTYLGDVPTGTSKLSIHVSGGVLLGNRYDVATVPAPVGIYVASGGTYIIDGIGATSHGWYGLATGSTNATLTLDAAW